MKTNYPKQLKQELVKRCREGETVSIICLQTGIARSTLYAWIKHYKTVETESGTVIDARDYMRQKQHVEKLENMIEVLKIVDCNIEPPLKVKLEELSKLYGKYSVHFLCDSLNVARGTFYNHIFRNKKDEGSYQVRRAMLSEKIKEVFDESNQIYVAKKIRAVLQAKGVNTTDKMVAELMNEMDLKSIRNETKKQYTRSLKEEKKDVLKLNFSAKSPNQVWVSDITYYKVCKQTRYIGVIIYLFSRKVIACKISQRQSTQLITSIFKSAYQSRRPESELVFHSDRGGQYTAYAFQKLLKNYRITQSFSPSARPCHNAVMESFFASLKKEELYRVNYKSIREFEKSVEVYIERYNNERPHVSLRYKTPNAYEKVYFDKLKNELVRQ
jgi:transposase InsO family protein/transposase-like protein